MTRHLHIISHTHWDREWYLTFQQFRLRLVDLVDNLLEARIRLQRLARGLRCRPSSLSLWSCRSTDR
jgi:hypothetical protein